MGALTMQDVYLNNVWRMVFEATRESGRWVAIEDAARFTRIEVMGLEEGRSLQADLDAAQAAIEGGQNREQWKSALLATL